MSAIELFDKGGLVMYVLAGLSIYALGVIIFKIYQFANEKLFDYAAIDNAIARVRAGDIDGTRDVLEHGRGPLVRIMKVTINCILDREMSQRQREAEISRVGSNDLRYLESHLRGLEMVANVSPLLGLLGTVIGMVTAFSRLENAGTRVDPSLLAGGIWEALLTTVGGLVVAIPAIAAYYIFDGIIERVRGGMKDVSVQVMALEDDLSRMEREEWKKKAEIRARTRKEEAVRKEQAEEARLRAEVEEKRRVEEERLRSIENARSAPESSSTLRLLNPRY